ncbi:MAG: substrate-binding domain-containing protein [Thermoflexales bacterium]|nr:substrate-binding domain-containing protein [Thermoflexales bacterium]
MLASCLALCAACGPTPTITREPVTISLAATAATAPLVADLTEAYRAEHPYVSFQVTQADSHAAVEAVLAGEAELAAVTQISTSESIWLTPVAFDNIAIVVHPTNPITDLTVLQLRAIFQGRNSAWSEVNGAAFLNGATDIAVITRERDSELRTEISRYVLEGRHVTPNALVAPSDEAVINMVSTITSALGYVSMSYRPPGVKMIAVEGVLPTPFTAADRSYPLHRPVYLVAWQEPDPETEAELREFVAWALSSDGQRAASRRYGRVK